MEAKYEFIQYGTDNISTEIINYVKKSKECDLAKYTLMVNYGPIGRTVKGLLESEDIELTEMIKIVFKYYDSKLNEKNEPNNPEN